MNPALLLKVLPGLLKTVGKLTGLSKVSEAGEALAGAPALSPDKAAELEVALGAQMVELRRVEADELKAILAEHIEEVKSDDAYVRRARPTGLYVFYLVSVAVVVGLLLKIDIDPAAILTVIGPLAGVGGYYVGNRTKEKTAA
jgi:hypothetical protein